MAVRFNLPCEKCDQSVHLEAPDDPAAHVLIDAWLDGATLYRCTICRALPHQPVPGHLTP